MNHSEPTTGNSDACLELRHAELSQLDLSDLGSLIAECQPGWSLPGRFYSAPLVYRADLECVWRRGWLFAGHSCEIPRAGDYFTLDVDSDPLIVIRDDSGQVRALHNVCRHRGSLVCTEARGNARRLVCPYHQWTYACDGRLVTARGMQENLDKAQFNLIAVTAHEVAGMIFINLAQEPGAFEPARRLLEALAGPQGLVGAKVAHACEYLVKANWKLVWENNRECFHCNVNHPQYIKANFDHYNADDASPRIKEQIALAIQRGQEKWSAAGLAPTHPETGMTKFPDAENNIWFSANRTPLVDGYLSETMNGQTVAPLMGDYREADVGTLRMRALPNFWNHSSCDHSVSTRLLPAGPELTAIRVLWLVRADAVEGHDYHLEQLLPFWQLTSEQDWIICERQQRGVRSSAYRPGPYSIYKEYNVDSFVRWYLAHLRRRTLAVGGAT
jgi:Rieske 2Fe-2S family protein